VAVSEIVNQPLYIASAPTWVVVEGERGGTAFLVPPPPSQIGTRYVFPCYFFRKCNNVSYNHILKCDCELSEIPKAYFCSTLSAFQSSHFNIYFVYLFLFPSGVAYSVLYSIPGVGWSLCFFLVGPMILAWPDF